MTKDEVRKGNGKYFKKWIGDDDVRYMIIGMVR